MPSSVPGYHSHAGNPQDRASESLYRHCRCNGRRPSTHRITRAMWQVHAGIQLAIPGRTETRCIALLAICRSNSAYSFRSPIVGGRSSSGSSGATAFHSPSDFAIRSAADFHPAEYSSWTRIVQVVTLCQRQPAVNLIEYVPLRRRLDGLHCGNEFLNRNTISHVEHQQTRIITSVFMLPLFMRFAR